jgi:PEP-CTERM motif
LILAGIAQVLPEAHADITYNLLDHPTLENGYTLTGTITIGALGQVSSINAWTVEILNQGTLITTFSSSTAGANTNISGDLEATDTTLTLSSNSVLQMNISNFNGNNGLNYIPAVNIYLATDPFAPTTYWNTTIPNQPFIIATSVPEPSTLAIAGLAGVCGIAYVLGRKRRSERRQGAGGQTHPTE